MGNYKVGVQLANMTAAAFDGSTSKGPKGKSENFQTTSRHGENALSNRR